MKSILLSAFVILFAINCFSGESQVGVILGGKHELGKIGAFSQIAYPNGITNSSNSYFICRMKNDENFYVTFRWELNGGKGEYAISELPYTKIRVTYSKGTVPYIKFKWLPSSYNDLDIIMGRLVQYALIVCDESFWINPNTFTNSVTTNNISTNSIIELEKTTYIDAFKEQPFKMALALMR